MFPTLLLLASLAHANPIACELRGELVAGDDGRHVVASFLGACDEIMDYDKALAVQVQEGSGWKVLGGQWERTGRREADGGSGAQDYGFYQQEVGCPGEGTHAFRLAWIDEDGAEGWFGEDLACGGAGCAAAPGRPVLGLWLLAGIGLLVPRRREPTTRWG
ncbi:MAG: hypothetical protein ABIO70_18645 [Pseudomonadota bacterium]